MWYGVWTDPGFVSKRPSDVESMLERVLGNSPELKWLEISGCDIERLPMAAIAKLADLQVLRLRDFAEQWEAERSRRSSSSCLSPKGRPRSPPRHSDKDLFPSISLANLELIQQSCSLITELDLGIDTEQSNVNAFSFQTPAETLTSPSTPNF